jgi:hypothetical protein
MLRNAVLGTWELVSYTAQDKHGGPVAYPLGPDALGVIMYTADGYMSAQLMRRDRPAFDRPEPDGGTPEQAEAAAAGYLAYSGPFTVDEFTGVLGHGVAPTQLAQPNPTTAQQARRTPSNIIRHHRDDRRYTNHQHTGVETGTRTSHGITTCQLHSVPR